MSRPTQVPVLIMSRYLYGPFTLYGPTFQTVPVPDMMLVTGPTTPAAPQRDRFRLFPFRSPLLWESIFLSFPAGTKMFQFPASAPTKLSATGLQPAGLPHSDISGSIPVCRSPELFAAYHVLHRFRKPRHPPFALVLFLVLISESFATFTSQIVLLVCL